MSLSQLILEPSFPTPGIGGGTGGRRGGGWSVCVYVLWRSLVGGLEDWREVPVVCLSVSCCVCCLFGVHVVFAWSMIVVTVWCLMFECGVVDASV